MRRHFSVLLVALAVLVSLSARADDWNKSYPVSGKPDIHVETNDADVEVHSSSGKAIEVHVVTRRWKIGDEVRIVDHQVGDRLDLEVRRPSHNFCFGVCNQSVRIELTVPHEASLNLHTGDGNIRVSDVHGELRFQSGDGNIEAHSIQGKLVADTSDGNIRADGRFAGLDLHTGDGNVDVEASSDSAMTTGWSIRTGDGHIVLRLPENLAADLDVHTGDGRVSVDLPVTVTGSIRENSVRGKINGGGPLLELRSGDGDIRLLKN